MRKKRIFPPYYQPEHNSKRVDYFAQIDNVEETSTDFSAKPLRYKYMVPIYWGREVHLGADGYTLTAVRYS